MDQVSIIAALLTLWLGTLTYVWTRHVQDDKEKVGGIYKDLAKQDDRINRAIGRIDVVLSEMRMYQTDFNLKTATTLAEIKQALQQR